MPTIAAAMIRMYRIGLSLPGQPSAPVAFLITVAGASGLRPRVSYQTSSRVRIGRVGKRAVVLKRLTEIVCLEHLTASLAACEMPGLVSGLAIDGLPDSFAPMY